MLSITLPRMNKLLDEIGITALSAQCYHVQREPPTYLVVEDLKEKSFQMAERHAGLDLDHCWVTLRKLAAFHASSVALREKVFTLRNYDSIQFLTFPTSPRNQNL